MTPTQTLSMGTLQAEQIKSLFAQQVAEKLQGVPLSQLAEHMQVHPQMVGLLLDERAPLPLHVMLDVMCKLGIPYAFQIGNKPQTPPPSEPTDEAVHVGS